VAAGGIACVHRGTAAAYTPPKTARLGNDSVSRHTLTVGGGTWPTTGAEYSDDFDTNPPLVLLENTVAAGDPVKLSTSLAPTGSAILWQIVRNPADHASLGSATPTLLPSGAMANLLSDAAGSFRVRAYFDENGAMDMAGNPMFMDGDPYIMVNLASPSRP
jgi:hypothetical protein